MPSNALSNAILAEPDSASVLSEFTYQRIRKEIVSGRIVPGSKLKVEALQKQLGVSSSPIREALTRLSAEDYVIADQRRGFRAARVSVGDLNDITQFRLVIEVHGFVDSIVRGSKAWETSVVAAIDRLEATEQSVGRSERMLSDAWIDKHKDFHMALISASSSPRLITECSTLFDQAQRYRSLYALSRSGGRRGTIEHRQLVGAALKRDRILAAELLRDHISKTATYVAGVIESGRLQMES